MELTHLYSFMHLRLAFLGPFNHGEKNVPYHLLNKFSLGRIYVSFHMGNASKENSNHFHVAWGLKQALTYTGVNSE